MSEPKHHPIFTLLLIILTAVATWAYLERKHDEGTAALMATASTPFHHTGPATVARGNVTTPKDANNRVEATLGKPLLSEITGSGGTVVETLLATASVPAVVSNPETTQTSMAGVANTARLVQDRGGNPPLASVAVSFTPPFFTTTWTSYQETFTVATTSWRTAENGLRAALRLTRHVNDASGAPVGAPEEIPVTNADAYFPAPEVLRLYPQPTWSFGMGPATEMRTGKSHLMGVFGKQWTRQWGTDFGHVNGNTFAIVRYTGGFK